VSSIGTRPGWQVLFLQQPVLVFFAGITYLSGCLENTPAMRLTVLGCGDAFASGGQLNTCFHVQHTGIQVLLDCGATSLIGVRRQQIRSADIDYIVLSHFHGDHYGGVPFVLLDALVAKRTRPLTVISPPGGQSRIELLTECLYPGVMAQAKLAFPIHYHEYQNHQAIETPHFHLQAWPVIHSPDSLPHAIRLTWEGRHIGFSGDTEWTDALRDVADATDLFICECNFYDQDKPSHLSYHTLQKRLPDLNTRRIVLTHLGESMLERKDSLALECLHEGQSLEI